MAYGLKQGVKIASFPLTGKNRHFSKTCQRLSPVRLSFRPRAENAGKQTENQIESVYPDPHSHR
jgi:hypothetical protein